MEHTAKFGDERMPGRFWAKVTAVESGCWLWTGSVMKNGYAQFYTEGHRLAHRAVYAHLRGSIPDRMQVDHLCHGWALDTCHGGEKCPHRRCVNPAHLDLKTQRKNVLAGHAVSAKHARKTHCKSGHEFTAANTRMKRIRGLSTRKCRACDRAEAARGRQRRRAMRDVQRR